VAAALAAVAAAVAAATATTNGRAAFAKMADNGRARLQRARRESGAPGGGHGGETRANAPKRVLHKYNII